MLNTSLALLARSRAWVGVSLGRCCSTGPAACAGGSAQRVAGGHPDVVLSRIRGRWSIVKLLFGCWLPAGVAVSPLITWPRALYAYGPRSAVGNPLGHRSTPLSARGLRMLPAVKFIVPLAQAVGKCQNQMLSAMCCRYDPAHVDIRYGQQSNFCEGKRS